MIPSIRHFAFLVLLAAGLSLTSCQADGNSTGTIYMPDMTYSNAVETYASTNYVPAWDSVMAEGDTISARRPVEGTIARGSLPDLEQVRTDERYMRSYFMSEYFLDPAHHPEVDADQYEASSMLVNPVPKTAAAFEEGKALYVKNCVVCHGDKGMGDGSIVSGTTRPDGSDGPYTAIPPAYSARLPLLTDGQMFYSITYGKGMMGPYRSHLSVEDRWKVIYYIKELADLDAPDEASDLGLDSLAADGVLTEGYEMDVPGIYFAYDSDELHPASAVTLDQVAGYLKEHDDVRIEIGGHTDTRGTGAYNQQLSEERALAVRQYLMDTGVPSAQIEATGYGTTDPAVECTECTEADHAANRRISVRVLGEAMAMMDDHDGAAHHDEAHGDDHSDHEHH